MKLRREVVEDVKTGPRETGGWRQIGKGTEMKSCG